MKYESYIKLFQLYFFLNIARSDVGRFFGNIAKKAFDFYKCAIPGLESIDHCVKDAIRSAGSCLQGRLSCRMKIGGRGSSCLRVSLTKSFTKSYGKYHFMKGKGWGYNLHAQLYILLNIDL